MCIRLLLGEMCVDEPAPFTSNMSQLPQQASSQPATTTTTIQQPTVLHAGIPPPNFCAIVLKLTTFLMQTLGQQYFSLEMVCAAETLGSNADRIESLLCYLLIPLFLRAATAKKGAY
jgi:hypothetical protein